MALFFCCKNNILAFIIFSQVLLLGISAEKAFAWITVYQPVSAITTEQKMKDDAVSKHIDLDLFVDADGATRNLNFKEYTQHKRIVYGTPDEVKNARGNKYWQDPDTGIYEWEYLGWNKSGKSVTQSRFPRLIPLE